MSKENIICNVIQEYKKALEVFEDEIIIENLSNNKIVALENEIIESEKKLGCSFPNELREYYLHCANGTYPDVNNYGEIYDYYNIDIFSHQRVYGIVDYFEHYWNLQEVELDIVYAQHNDEEIAYIQQCNKDFLVCAVDWKENFSETFVFDKEHNFYRFYFDQDVSVLEYIKKLKENDKSISKDKNLAKLLNSYFEYEINKLKDTL